MLMAAPHKSEMDGWDATSLLLLSPDCFSPDLLWSPLRGDELARGCGSANCGTMKRGGRKKHLRCERVCERWKELVMDESAESAAK